METNPPMVGHSQHHHTHTTSLNLVRQYGVVWWSFVGTHQPFGPIYQSSATPLGVTCALEPLLPCPHSPESPRGLLKKRSGEGGRYSGLWWFTVLITIETGISYLTCQFSNCMSSGCLGVVLVIFEQPAVELMQRFWQFVLFLVTAAKKKSGFYTQMLLKVCKL